MPVALSGDRACRLYRSRTCVGRQVAQAYYDSREALGFPDVRHRDQEGGRVMTQAKTAPLLVELLTEELPPKALARFGEVFRRASLPA